MLTFRIIAKQKFTFAKTRVGTQNYIVFETTTSSPQPRLRLSLFWRQGGALLIDTLGRNFVSCADINFNENYVKYQRFSSQLKPQVAKWSTPRDTLALITDKSVKWARARGGIRFSKTCDRDEIGEFIRRQLQYVLEIGSKP